MRRWRRNWRRRWRSKRPRRRQRNEPLTPPASCIPCHACPRWHHADHGIPQEDIDAAFAAGRAFLGQGKQDKGRYPFNPDSYLGWRGPDELETVTGGYVGVACTGSCSWPCMCLCAICVCH